MGRIVAGLVRGGKVTVDWRAPALNWPKDWAKLLMNATLLAADALPRGGQVTVQTSEDPAQPGFSVRAVGQNARVLEEVEKAVRGEPVSPLDGRSVQGYLTHKLASAVNAGLQLATRDGAVELTAG